MGPGRSGSPAKGIALGLALLPLLQCLAFAPPQAMITHLPTTSSSYDTRIPAHYLPAAQATAQRRRRAGGSTACGAEGGGFSVGEPPARGLFGKLFGGEDREGREREAFRAGLKRKLEKAVLLRQGRESRRVVESYLEELVRLGVREREDLTGAWRLEWSSQTAESNPFALPSSVLGGECFQDISAMSEDLARGRVENIVSWPSLGLTLRGGATIDVTGPGVSVVTIDSFTLEGPKGWRLPLLSLTDSADIVVNDAPKVLREGSQVVTVSSKGERRLNQRQGELEELYIDREGLRITRGDTGLLYVYTREEV